MTKPQPTTVVQDFTTNNMHLGYAEGDTLKALCNRRFNVWERGESAEIVNDWNDYGCARCESKAGESLTESVVVAKYRIEVAPW